MFKAQYKKLVDDKKLIIIRERKEDCERMYIIKPMDHMMLNIKKEYFLQ